MECPACGCNASEKLDQIVIQPKSTDRKVLFYLSRCSDCQSHFAEPRKSASPEWYQDIKEYYDSRWEFDEGIRDIERRPGTKRVLEIACGEGVFLEKLNKNYEVYGVDFNSQAVLRARQRNMRASCCTITEFAAQHPQLKFDVIVFFHLLEHLEDPRLFLETVREILIPGGTIILSVPNEKRFSLLLGHEWWDYPPHHLTRFSHIGIAHLLTSARFMISEVRDEPNQTTAYLWAIMYSHRLIHKLGWAAPHHVPKVTRIILKLLVLPMALLHFFTVHRKRSKHAGLALYIVANS